MTSGSDPALAISDLDVAYTAFGRVVEGLDVLDRIDVDTPILRVRVAEAR